MRGRAGRIVLQGLLIAAAWTLFALFSATRRRSSAFASQRDEAAMSRLYGGIHYPSDIEVGKPMASASPDIRCGSLSPMAPTEPGSDPDILSA